MDKSEAGKIGQLKKAEKRQQKAEAFQSKLNKMNVSRLQSNEQVDDSEQFDFSTSSLSPFKKRTKASIVQEVVDLSAAIEKLKTKHQEDVERQKRQIVELQLQVDFEKSLKEWYQKEVERVMGQNAELKLQLNDEETLKLAHQEEVEQYKHQIVELESQLIDALTNIQLVQQQKENVDQKLAAMPSIPRKTLDQLGSKQFATRTEILKKQLGAGYQITKTDAELKLSINEYQCFRRIYRLPTRTVNALSRLPNSLWPTVRQLDYFEQKMINECGGFVQDESDGTKTIWIANTKQVFINYLKNLNEAAWNGKHPDKVKVVISGDKGSDWSKFGLFVPTEVSNAQSPYNFLLLAAFEGPEQRQLIERATRTMFDFANQLIENGGIEANIGSGVEFIQVEVLFVADLKMMSLILGVNHSASTNFCPICLVKRSDHKKQASVGKMRNLQTDEQKFSTLLNVPIENIVTPPLHMLQGAVNQVLKNMEKDSRKNLFKHANVKPTHQLSSLLTGRNCQKLLKYVYENPIQEVNYRTTLTYLYKISQWASIEKFAAMKNNVSQLHSNLQQLINKFSEAWRDDKLPLINKLHLFESHLADFIVLHNGWGCYGEQGVEALHRMGNIANKCCFGRNQKIGLNFFMKMQLVLSLSNMSKFEQTIGDKPEDNDDEEEDIISDDYIVDWENDA